MQRFSGNLLKISPCSAHLVTDVIDITLDSFRKLPQEKLLWLAPNIRPTVFSTSTHHWPLQAIPSLVRTLVQYLSTCTGELCTGGLLKVSGTYRFNLMATCLH